MNTQRNGARDTIVRDMGNEASGNELNEMEKEKMTSKAGFDEMKKKCDDFCQAEITQISKMFSIRWDG